MGGRWDERKNGERKSWRERERVGEIAIVPICAQRYLIFLPVGESTF